ncbi:DUF6115 domain-containing protein [Acetivibrio clariflavus]|uniref:Uncharacterized protein n=1 Tax=Acetivibrio clariflavus (strain DSM 19732 / NBRC 101661 / EBR45) TaxID=720554 RepID=G8LVE6_ACECE|nr:hypothetical protein [Acetivibrio clariflavus]AEV68535.1 hypothetical protein Clocl_1933 [Acetivibrio clariflavus DSM 19732]
MVGFYSSIIFIGIVLIVVSIVWIMYDKKEAYDMELRMDEKKAELLKIISDAEEMVEELNKFSDYVITRVEEKNSEMDLKFAKAEKLLENLKREIGAVSNFQKKEALDSNSVDLNPMVLNDESMDENNSVNVNDNEEIAVSKMEAEDDKSMSKSDEKVVTLNSKHNEVLMLAKKGLNETEIAKKLNMGKGEIQLILGVNR